MSSTANYNNNTSSSTVRVDYSKYVAEYVLTVLFSFFSYSSR